MTTMIDEAAEAVRGGELIVFPTDTVYGIGCDPFNTEAVQALFLTKQRPKDKVMPLLVDSLETAEALGEITPKSKELIEKYWPGALTIVVSAKSEFAEGIVKEGNIFLRIPNHEDLLELITNVGGVIAATSANISGKPPVANYDEAYATFSELAAVVVPGVARIGEPSTVIDCTTDEFKVVREGPIKL